MQKNITMLLTLGSSFLITACSTSYSFNSNLDSNTINEYFKASEVQVYQGSLQPEGAYKVIGLVEGESCQELTNAVPASKADARTKLRRKAADLHANGVIIKKCALMPEDDSIAKSEQRCYSRVICVAQAIDTTSNN